MVAIGVLMLSLINDSEQGKADARAGGLAAEAGSLYLSEAASARTDAETLARAVGSLRGKALSVRFAALATRAGLARATLSDTSRTIVDVGDRTAIAPGSVIARDPVAGRSITVMVSELTASQYTRELSSPGVAVLVRRRAQGPRLDARAATLPLAIGGREPDASRQGVPRRQPDVPGLWPRPGDRHGPVGAIRDRHVARR